MHICWNFEKPKKKKNQIKNPKIITIPSNKTRSTVLLTFTRKKNYKNLYENENVRIATIT